MAAEATTTAKIWADFVAENCARQRDDCATQAGTADTNPSFTRTTTTAGDYAPHTNDPDQCDARVANFCFVTTGLDSVVHADDAQRRRIGLALSSGAGPSMDVRIKPGRDEGDERKKTGGSPEAAGKPQHALASQTTFNFNPWLPAPASTTRILYNHNTTA